MWRPCSSRFWDAERIQEERNWGRSKTTKNVTVFGTSPPSRCFTMNFTTIVLGLKPSGTQKDWQMPKPCPWTSLDACAVCWPVLTPCKDFWKQLPTSFAAKLARGRKYSIKKNKAYRVPGQKRKRAPSQLNHVSFVWEPRAVDFKLLLLTETIIGLKPLCM